MESTGASGALVVVDLPEERFRGIARYLGTPRLELGEPSPLGLPVLLVRRGSLPEGLPTRPDDRSGGRSGWSASVRARANLESAEAMNTIGWIEGSDPELRDEYVIFTAHMDHVGVGEPVDGDSIYNGADDDASGTAAVLELAEAFGRAEEKPRRSVVFMTVSGEEKGLLGSRWYSEHPVFPLEATVANLNMDMIGRNWRDTVVAIGQDHSTLGDVLDRVVASHPELDMTVVEDRWPEERLFFRSDHYNFARKGVPALFFFSGLHEDYHRPSDEPDGVLYGKTARIVRLLYHLGSAVADADERPRWDPESYRSIVEGGEGPPGSGGGEQR
jgi:Zn-dependent M28 family amino/carboxypeptidase